MSEKRPLPWSLKGVSLEAREAARLAARSAGIPVGVWVSRAIRDVSAAEASLAAPAAPAGAGRDEPDRDTTARAIAGPVPPAG